jgi:hypothetical protein
MHTGSCLCGHVRYAYDGTIDTISRCHCRECRKAHGTAFAAVAPLARPRFRITAGTALLKGFRSSPGKERIFCGECGSPIYSARDDRPGEVRLRVGTLDTSPEGACQYHQWVAECADWDAIADAHPQHRGPAPRG